MSEPTTSIGKSKVREAKDRLSYGMYMQWEWPDINKVVIAIEREAAQQERERLLERVEAEWYNGNVTESAYARILDPRPLLADPEDDR